MNTALTVHYLRDREERGRMSDLSIQGLYDKLEAQAAELANMTKQHAMQKEIADNQTWHVQNLKAQLATYTEQCRIYEKEIAIRASEFQALVVRELAVEQELARTKANWNDLWAILNKAIPKEVRIAIAADGDDLYETIVKLVTAFELMRVDNK